MYKQEIPAESMARRSRFESMDRMMSGGAESIQTFVSKPDHELARERERYSCLAADFDNYKRRMRREMERRAASQKEAFVRELLPAVDNLERALKAKIRSDESFFKGVQMVFDQLLECLRHHGFHCHDLDERSDESFPNAIAVDYDADKSFRPARIVDKAKAKVKCAA
jgi:molecular chaperone GrpE